MGKVATAIIMDACMKGKSRIMRPMELVFIMTRTRDMSIMGSGRMMCHMERERKSFRMGRIMKESSFMVLSRGLVIMCVTLAFTRGSSRMETFMGMAFLLMLIIVSTMESGKTVSLKVLEFSHGLTETGIKAST